MPYVCRWSGARSLLTAGTRLVSSTKAWRSPSSAAAPESRRDQDPGALPGGAGRERDVDRVPDRRRRRPLPMHTPEPPTTITSFGQTNVLPAIVTTVMLVLAVAALAHALVSSVRRRRRDFAILETLGCERRQLSAAVGGRRPPSPAAFLVRPAGTPRWPLGVGRHRGRARGAVRAHREHHRDRGHRRGHAARREPHRARCPPRSCGVRGRRLHSGSSEAISYRRRGWRRARRP